MMVILLIAGIGVLLAGLAVIAYGVVLDLSFGNSLIVAGTVAACSGLIVLSLTLVTAELKRIARRLGDTRGAGEAPVRSLLPPPAAPSRSGSEGGLLFSRDQESTPNTATAVATQSPSPPWDEEPASRPRHEAASEPASPEARSQPTASEGAEPPASFETAWSRIERARAGEVPPSRRSGRAPSTFADAGTD